MTDENTTNSDNGNTDVWAKIHATLDRITERQEKTEQLIAATSRQMAKTDKKMAKTDKKISQLGKQHGRLGNKFGYFTEGLAMSSIKRIMEDDLDADYIGEYVDEDKKEVGPVQIDAWGVARNGAKVVYLVEVKSRYKSEHIRQVRNLVRKFRLYKTEYKDYRICPMIAAVQIKKNQRLEIWNADMYLIDVADGVFRLAEHPDGIRPDGLPGDEGQQRDVPNFRMVPGGLTDGEQSQHGN